MLRMLQGEVGIARLVKYMSAQPSWEAKKQFETNSNSMIGSSNKYFDHANNLTLITEETENRNGLKGSAINGHV